MLTGQETVRDILLQHPKALPILNKYGITKESADFLGYKNLAHAAVKLKIPLKKILEELSLATGQQIKTVKVSGIQAPPSSGVRKGGLENIRRVIAVHSGKGGVGKTFVAVNFAAFIAQRGLKVGLLDADIDCPNIFHMLRAEGKLLADESKRIIPLEKFGMKIVSMSPLLKTDDEALLWRGPIVSRVLEQFMYDVAWGDLDVLVVDLPPGTSDIPLTLYNMLPRTEVLLVTTPHELGLLDAKKAAMMASKMKISVLGFIENMSGEVFNKHGSLDGIEVPFLGSIPLHPNFAMIHKDGRPHVFDSKDLQEIFKKIRI